MTAVCQHFVACKKWYLTQTISCFHGSRVTKMTSIPDRLASPFLSYLMLQGLIMVHGWYGWPWHRNDSTFYHLVEVQSCHAWKSWMQLIEVSLKKKKKGVNKRVEILRVIFTCYLIMNRGEILLCWICSALFLSQKWVLFKKW